MNLKTAKRIRKAVSYRPHQQQTQYEDPQVHHLSAHPQYEKHLRTTRTWNLRQKKIVDTEVSKIRYDGTGRTPLRPILVEVKNEAGVVHLEPQTELVPIGKPCRLKKGSPRQVYRLLKRLERTVGLDNVFAQLAAEAGTPCAS